MTYLVGAVGFVVALLVSVMLHEGGHFLTARHYGMKATQFFVGFGPTLFSRRRGETEYGVKAVPAGGYVKIVGMTPLEEVEPGDDARAFYRQPVRRKVVVLAAGSTMHFVIAVVLVLAGTFAIGVPAQRAPSVAQVTACVPPAVTPAQPGPVTPGRDANGCAPGDPLSPALGAGLRAGDTVVAADGRPIGNTDDLLTAIRGSAGVPVTLTVVRDGNRRDVTMTPVRVQRPDLQDRTRTVQVGAVGFVPHDNVVTEHVGPVASLRASGAVMQQFFVGIKTTVTDKLGSVADLYSSKRDPEGLVGVVGATRISGDVLGSTETLGVKALTFVLLVASLNLFVGLFNLLPLLPLDGGHIAVVVYEGARDRLRRLRGYRGPFQRVDYNKLLPVTYGVAAAFLLLTVFILGADIVNPIRFRT